MMVLAEQGWSPSRIELALGVSKSDQSHARAEYRENMRRAEEKKEEMQQRALKAGYSIGEVSGDILNAMLVWCQQEWGRRPNAQERRQLGLI